MYLLTAPRFLNYNLSPASFWYLYTASMQLQHVIAEVSNTFDERRMCLFTASNSATLFQGKVAKDFHVSPFDSRRGRIYSISTTDPAETSNIDIKIFLRSSKNHVKILTRLWPCAPAFDPASCSFLNALGLLLNWGWTIPLRPEPRSTAIPRRATWQELLIAEVLGQYLQNLLNYSPYALNLAFYLGIHDHKTSCEIQHI